MRQIALPPCHGPCYPTAMASRSLTTADLTRARLAYEAGATFANQHHVAEVTMRRMLRSLGVEPRPRGNVPTALTR